MHMFYFVGANRVIRFGGNVNDVSIMMDRVVRTCVRRTSELELVQSRDPAWLKTVKLNLRIFGKTVCYLIMYFSFNAS